MKLLTLLALFLTLNLCAQTTLQPIDSNTVPIAARNYVNQEIARFLKSPKGLTWYHDDYTEDTVHYIYSAHRTTDSKFTDIWHFDSLAKHVSAKFVGGDTPSVKVATAFKEAYPNTYEVSWLVYPPWNVHDTAMHWPKVDSMYVAHFNLNAEEITAIYSPAGKCTYIHITLPLRYLPSDIAAYLNTHYHKYKMYLWGRYVQDGKWTYIVSLTKGIFKKSYDAYFDGNGKFVKLQRGEFRTAHEDRIEGIGNFFFPAWQQLALK